MTKGEHMDPELTALAASGATALVQQMVNDGWAQVRERLARAFSRGRPGPGDEAGAGAEAVRAVREELEASREDLVAAREAGDQDVEADVEAEWRSRLRRALHADPRFAEELRGLLDGLGPQAPADAGGDTYNTVIGGAHGIVVQARTVGSPHITPQPPHQHP
ncbi:hypothetical protein [Streptomyces sulfonofaciens]|nr:hypothetical protein [Streptomyces sulfonofaciens]